MRRTLTLVTAAPAYPITRTEAKTHCRIDDTDSDTYIDALIAASTAHLDGNDGILGRALIEQTWDMKLDRFPAYGCAITVPLPPLISVGSITYTDANGDSQTLSSSIYQVVGVGGFGRGEIVEAYGQVWPDTRDIPEAVTVRFTAGYSNSGASPVDYADNVPAGIKHALKLMVGDAFENRETGVVGVSSADIKTSVTVDRLLAPYCVPWT